MAQWASAFTESAMGVSKTIGDLAGPCLFAVLMGISRVFYGKMSEKLDLTKTEHLLCGENDLFPRIAQAITEGQFFLRYIQRAFLTDVFFHLMLQMELLD